MRKMTITTTLHKLLRKLPSLRERWYVYLCHAALITALSVTLSQIVLHKLDDLAVFTATGLSNDLQVSDLYNLIADGRDVAQVSPYVTVLAVDDCSRQQLLEVLELVSAYDPHAIGLDIFFRFANHDSALVVNTLQSIPNLVLPCQLLPQSSGQYIRTQSSFFEQYLDADYAYVNLNADDPTDVIRDFTPFMILANGDTMRHMATELARLAAPDNYRTLLQRGRQQEIIQFASVTIDTLSAAELLTGDNEAYLTSRLTHRLVLVGDLHNTKDMFLTPLSGLMPGVMIHAYALNTIMAEAYTAVSPVALNWLIAIICCLLFVLINLIVNELYSHMGNMIMRLLQLLLMFGVVIFGAYCYTRHMLYLDFSSLLFLLGFAALAMDIFEGLYVLYHKCTTKQRQS